MDGDPRPVSLAALQNPGQVGQPVKSFPQGGSQGRCGGHSIGLEDGVSAPPPGPGGKSIVIRGCPVPAQGPDHLPLVVSEDHLGGTGDAQVMDARENLGR